MESTRSREGRATKRNMEKDNKWRNGKCGKVWREVKAMPTNHVRWKVLTEALCSARE